MLDKLWQQNIKLHAAQLPPLATTGCSYVELVWPVDAAAAAAAVQVVVRVTWDTGDVDQFVKEAVELWDSQR
jgi:hypothetical protein